MFQLVARLRCACVRACLCYACEPPRSRGVEASCCVGVVLARSPTPLPLPCHAPRLPCQRPFSSPATPSDYPAMTSDWILYRYPVVHGFLRTANIHTCLTNACALSLLPLTDKLAQAQPMYSWGALAGFIGLQANGFYNPLPAPTPEA